jgi:hypothetical protein
MWLCLRPSLQLFSVFQNTIVGVVSKPTILDLAHDQRIPLSQRNIGMTCRADLNRAGNSLLLNGIELACKLPAQGFELCFARPSWQRLIAIRSEPARNCPDPAVPHQMLP